MTTMTYISLFGFNLTILKLTCKHFWTPTPPAVIDFFDP